MDFKLQAPFVPMGDQPEAITGLVEGVRAGKEHQVLLGATGTGKTFTMASVIQELQKPALIMAHNKTLAAQLYAEFRRFFPENAVSYFVSYYDYYQPEAYVRHDLYIEKETEINERSSDCVLPRPRHWSRAGMSLLLPRYHASMVWARRRNSAKGRWTQSWRAVPPQCAAPSAH